MHPVKKGAVVASVGYTIAPEGKNFQGCFKATKAIASMPPGHFLGALEMLSVQLQLQFPRRVPFTKEKMPLCIFFFQKRGIQAWFTHNIL